MEAQLKDLWACTESFAAEELKDREPVKFVEIIPEALSQTIDKIQTILKPKEEVSSKVKQKLNYMRREWPKNLVKYAVQEELLGG